MNITLSLNEDGRIFYEQNSEYPPNYDGSFYLYKALMNKGHNVNIVHPSDIYQKNGDIYSRTIYEFNNGFTVKNINALLEGEVFFVDGLGEDKSLDKSKSFMDFLYKLEKQFNYVLNSAESTSYEYKPKQKMLNLPWIPGYEIKRRDDLIDLVESGEKIIAKPSVGCFSNGILFIGNVDDILNIQKDEIGSYFYEKFIPATEERRYLFLDNEIIIKRKTFRKGPPGKEKCVGLDLMEGNPREIGITHKVMSITNMFYGTVDFRGNYVLEINGSGAGITPPRIHGQEPPYNLSSILVKALEEKIGITTR